MKLSLSKDLTAAKAEANANIDSQAETVRLLFITKGSGQVMEYQYTAEESEVYLANPPDPNADPSTFPLLKAEMDAINATGGNVTMLEVAEDVKARRDLWVNVGAQVKEIRRRQKLMVDQATSPAQIEAATQIDWTVLHTS